MLDKQNKILNEIQLLENGERFKPFSSWFFRICMRISCNRFLKFPYLSCFKCVDIPFHALAPELEMEGFCT